MYKVRVCISSVSVHSVTCKKCKNLCPYSRGLTFSVIHHGFSGGVLREKGV